MNQQNISNGQEGEQEVAIEGSRLKTAYAEAMRQNALTPIPREERLGQFERRFRNDCWYFAFYIIDWFLGLIVSELYTIY